MNRLWGRSTSSLTSLRATSGNRSKNGLQTREALGSKMVKTLFSHGRVWVFTSIRENMEEFSANEKHYLPYVCSFLNHTMATQWRVSFQGAGLIKWEVSQEIISIIQESNHLSREKWKGYGEERWCPNVLQQHVLMWSVRNRRYGEFSGSSIYGLTAAAIDWDTEDWGEDSAGLRELEAGD